MNYIRCARTDVCYFQVRISCWNIEVDVVPEEFDPEVMLKVDTIPR
jgi:hypothetical protein